MLFEPKGENELPDIGMDEEMNVTQSMQGVRASNIKEYFTLMDTTLNKINQECDTAKQEVTDEAEDTNSLKVQQAFMKLELAAEKKNHEILSHPDTESYLKKAVAITNHYQSEGFSDKFPEQFDAWKKYVNSWHRLAGKEEPYLIETKMASLDEPTFPSDEDLDNGLPRPSIL